MEAQENSNFYLFLLPVELQLEIAGWLSISGLGIFAQLSRVCNEYASSNLVWKRYFSQKTGGDPEGGVARLDKEAKRKPLYDRNPGDNLVIERKDNEEEPGYYKALYFRYAAHFDGKCPNCISRAVAGGWSGGSLCRPCFKAHGSMMITVKEAMLKFALTSEEMETHVYTETYLSPDRGVPTKYCYEYRARLVALAKWGSFEAIRREYLKALAKLPKQKPKEKKRKREETVVEEEPDPKKRRSGRLAGKTRSRYVDDVDIF